MSNTEMSYDYYKWKWEYEKWKWRYREWKYGRSRPHLTKPIGQLKNLLGYPEVKFCPSVDV